MSFAPLLLSDHTQKEGTYYILHGNTSSGRIYTYTHDNFVTDISYLFIIILYYYYYY